MESIFYFILQGISAIYMYMQNQQFHSKWFIAASHFAHVYVNLYKIYESRRERTSKFAVKEVRMHLLPST